MSLPQAVQRNADAVDAFYNQQANTAAAAGTPVDAAPTTGTPAEPTPPPENTPEVQQNWEEKYRVLQGKYNAEVPRLQQRARDLEAENAQLKSMQPAAAPAPQAVSVGELVSQIAKDVGSPELAQRIHALIRTETATAVAPVATQVTQVNQQVNQVQQTSVASAVDTLRGILRQQGIAFDKVDNDPLFIDWLNETDSATQAARRFGFLQAKKSGDLQAVADFYVRFVRDPRWSVASATPQSQIPKPTPSVQSSAPATPVVPVVPAWDGDSIKQFYRDVERGKYTDEDAKRLEREIFAFLATQR